MESEKRQKPTATYSARRFRVLGPEYVSSSVAATSEFACTEVYLGQRFGSARRGDECGIIDCVWVSTEICVG